MQEQEHDVSEGMPESFDDVYSGVPMSSVGVVSVGDAGRSNKKKAKKKEKPKRTVFQRIVMAVFFLGALVCLGLAAYHEYPYVASQVRHDQLLEDVTGEKDDLQDKLNKLMGKKKKKGKNPHKKLDWKKLKKINPDIIAWIYVPGTHVDYPVLLDNGKNYYLHRNFEKKYNILGSIYVPKGTSKDILDAHNLFYGHNMRSGQMFGDLSNYSSKSFWKKHKYVYLYFPGKEEQKWEIYSAHKTTTAHDCYKHGYELETQEYEKLLKAIWNDAYYHTGDKVPSSQRILTLSTCADRGRFIDRFVVHAKLTYSTKLEKLEQKAAEEEAQRQAMQQQGRSAGQVGSDRTDGVAEPVTPVTPVETQTQSQPVIPQSPNAPEN